MAFEPLPLTTEQYYKRVCGLWELVGPARAPSRERRSVGQDLTLKWDLGKRNRKRLNKPLRRINVFYKSRALH